MKTDIFARLKAPLAEKESFKGRLDGVAGPEHYSVIYKDVIVVEDTIFCHCEITVTDSSFRTLVRKTGFGIAPLRDGYVAADAMAFEDACCQLGMKRGMKKEYPRGNFVLNGTVLRKAESCNPAGSMSVSVMDNERGEKVDLVFWANQMTPEREQYATTLKAGMRISAFVERTRWNKWIQVCFIERRKGDS